jgi:predicted DNA-binding transcriptional regulator AlpA
MDINEITAKILSGRDLSKPAHRILVTKELEKIVEALRKDAADINQAALALIKKLPVDTNEYLSARDAAVYMGVAKSTVGLWISKKIFPTPTKIPNKVSPGVKNRWPKKELEEWREKNKDLLDAAYQRAGRTHKQKTAKKDKPETPESFEADFMETLNQINGEI